MAINLDNKQSSWFPRPGWLMLVPTTLPTTTEGGIELPESFTQKSQSGTVIKCGNKIDNELFLGKEIFFPAHQEYRVDDSDNGITYFVVNADHVILVRPTPEKQAKFVVT